MRRLLAIAFVACVPVATSAQASTNSRAPDGVMLTFQRVADVFGGRLVAAFDSIPEARYAYRPMPAQQSVGYIAQHLEQANYALCERMRALDHPRTSRDSLADTLKARWPKDTLVARLRRSLDFCDAAMEQVGPLQSAALASTLLAFETDLAEHYSQLATYMRLMGMVPPSALLPRPRTAIALPASALPAYVGSYRLSSSLELEITTAPDGLLIRSTAGGPPVRLWPESATDFFVNEVDAQVTFLRDTDGTVTGLVLHQYGRHREARKVR